MNQQDDFSYELISAYLDGELSPDELARVEQLLATSEDHRQSLDEIESLASAMRALATYRLSDQFPRRVVEVARQVDPTILADTAVARRPAGQLSRVSRRRQVMAFAMAVAATLLAAVFYAAGRDGADKDPRLPTSPRSLAQAGSGPSGAEHTLGQSRPRSPQQPADLPDPSAAERPPADGNTAAGGSVAGVSEPAIGSEAERDPPADAVANAGRSMDPPASSAAAQPEASDRAASMAASSPLEQPPAGRAERGSGASTRPLAGTQKMLLVIDVELTRVGAEEASFEHALNAHGIAFDTNLVVPPDLENALLKSRFFEPAKEPENPENKTSFMLVYVATQGSAVDNLWQYMKQREAQFSRVTLDLALMPGDMSIFEQLQQLAMVTAGLRSDLGEPQSERRGANAHRLILPPSWRGMPAAARQGPGGLADHVPGLVRPGTSEPDLPRDAADSLQRGLGDGIASALWGGQISTEALFVVRASGGG